MIETDEILKWRYRPLNEWELVEVASMRQQLLKAHEELTELRGNDLGALLARVPEEWGLGLSRDGDGWHAIWVYEDAIRAYQATGSSPDEAIRAATRQLLGEADRG